MVVSKVLKIHSEIFFISSLVKTNDFVFSKWDDCKSSEAIFTFVQRKKIAVCVKKMEGLEVNHQKHMHVISEFE